MTNITIVVRDGRVQEVFTRAPKSISVEVIDFDTQSLEEFEESKERYNHILRQKSQVDIL